MTVLTLPITINYEKGGYLFMKEKLNKLMVNKQIQAYEKASEAEQLVQEVKNTKLTKKIPSLIAGFCCAILTSLMPTMAFASSNTDTIDSFVTFICDWLIKIGAVVMMVGGVMFALGWQREDADGKTRGLQTLMAGAMVAAIGAAPSIFGL